MALIVAWRTGEAANGLGGDDPVAGHDDWKPVGATRLADRARRGAQHARQGAIGAHLAARDLADGAPHALLEGGAARLKRHVEEEIGISEVALHLAHHASGEAPARFVR